MEQELIGIAEEALLLKVTQGANVCFVVLNYDGSAIDFRRPDQEEVKLYETLND